jgi:hypothetical protein
MLLESTKFIVLKSILWLRIIGKGIFTDTITNLSNSHPSDGKEDYKVLDEGALKP